MIDLPSRGSSDSTRLPVLGCNFTAPCVHQQFADRAISTERQLRYEAFRTLSSLRLDRAGARCEYGGRRKRIHDLRSRLGLNAPRSVSEHNSAQRPAPANAVALE